MKICKMELTQHQKLNGSIQGEPIYCKRTYKPLELELLGRSKQSILLICHSGSMGIYLNSIYIEVLANTAIYIKPQDSVYCFDCTEPEITATTVLFNEEDILLRTSSAQKILNNIVVKAISLPQASCQKVLHALDLMNTTIQQGDSVALDIAFSLLAITICSIAKELEREQCEKPYSKPKRLCLNFCMLIDDCQARERSLAFYAHKLGVSPNHLSYVSAQVLGYSGGRYIDEAIAIRSRSELLFSSKSIAQISDDLGFSNQSFFGKFFKRRFGLSPINYRAKHQFSNNVVRML